MSDHRAIREDNRVPVIQGVSSVDDETTVSVRVNPLTKRLLVESDSSSGSTAYENRNDTTSDTNLVYLAKAVPGTLTSDAAWQIKRYNKSAGHMAFADDVTTFTKVWDDRTGYSY